MSAPRPFLSATCLFCAAAIPATALLAASSAVAQSAEVTGEVTTQAMEPVPGVPVVINGPEGRSVLFTDKKGRWTLYNAPAGEYSAEAILPDSMVTWEPPPAGDLSGDARPPSPPTASFTIDEKSIFSTLGGSSGITNVGPLVAPLAQF